MSGWSRLSATPGQRLLRGLLLGVLTWAYLRAALLVAEHVLVPASGCDELGCVVWNAVALATVPVVAAVLVTALRLPRQVLTWTLFVVPMVVLFYVGVLSPWGPPVDLLLLTGVAALAVSIAGAPLRRRRPIRAVGPDQAHDRSEPGDS